jgi:hypothetical protein
VCTNGDADVRDTDPTSALAAGKIIFHAGLALRCENDEPNLTSGAITWNPAFEWRKDVQFSGGDGRDVRGRD